MVRLKKLHAGSVPPPARWRFASLLSALLLVGPLLLSGCGGDDTVRHYRVPKKDILFASNHVDATARQADPAAATSPTDRLLGAIVPNGTQTWYFKMTGPMAAVAKQEASFRQLVESVQFEGPQGSPQWVLPESWQEKEASGQRRATLSVEVDGQSLEVSVIELATSPSPEAILDNVNRWRRQMGLAAIGTSELEQQSEKVTLAGGTATLVNLVGRFSSGSMGSSSLNTNGLASPVAPAAGAAGGGANDTAIKYEKPEGWVEEPAPEFSQMAFRVSQGDASAQVTISLLTGDGGGLQANLQRWRRQIGLSPAAPQELEAAAEEMTLQGIPGKFVALEGVNQEQQPEAILGWLGIRPDQSWFIKIRGNAELVRQQREPFRAFLNSLKFNAADGVSDGQ